MDYWIREFASPTYNIVMFLLTTMGLILNIKNLKFYKGKPEMKKVVFGFILTLIGFLWFSFTTVVLILSIFI